MRQEESVEIQKYFRDEGNSVSELDSNAIQDPQPLSATAGKGWATLDVKTGPAARL